MMVPPSSLHASEKYFFGCFLFFFSFYIYGPFCPDELARSTLTMSLTKASSPRHGQINILLWTAQLIRRAEFYPARDSRHSPKNTHIIAFSAVLLQLLLWHFDTNWSRNYSNWECNFGHVMFLESKCKLKCLTSNVNCLKVQ